MNNYNCIIVDDEPLARKVLKKYLSNLDAFELCGEASNVIEAFSLMENSRIDLIFLDINMPELSGIDFIKTLENKPSIIITTAHREYAVEGFELDVVDYLVKPITLPRFMNALNKFRRSWSMSSQNTNGTQSEAEEDSHIFIKADKRMIKTFYDEIIYVESLKDYVRVVTESEQIITHSNLSNFTNQLPSSKFIRIHKSYTISRSKIKALEGNTIEIEGRKLPIGRNFQQSVKKEILSR